MFHMYVGVRAGGGIGDEIEDPAGDEFEVERIIFDITFFFFVIVILLAIIQGESHAVCFTAWLKNMYKTHRYFVFTSVGQNSFGFLVCRRRTSLFHQVLLQTYNHDLF